MQGFLADSGFDAALIDRISFLIAHHHTMTGIDGMDYQILIEADFLVNAAEKGLGKEAVAQRKRTAAGGCCNLYFLTNKIAPSYLWYEGVFLCRF